MNLFPNLLRFAIKAHEDTNAFDIFKTKAQLTSEKVENLKNGVDLPTAQVLKAFSIAFNVKSNTLDFYLNHEEKPTRWSRKFAKKICILTDRVIAYFLNK